MLPLPGVRSARIGRDLMPARPPVRGLRTFASLAASARRAREGPIAVRYLPGEPPASVSYAIPRVVGTAVVRNRLRRRARAVMASLDLAPGAWLVVFNTAAVELTYEHLFDILAGLTDRVAAT